jgi:two-component system aerobic respiration control sensor histidine kinase ArcB
MGLKQESGLSIEELFASIPGHIYAKDKNGVYLAANDRDESSCALDGTKRGSQLVGKTDRDFPWKGIAEELRLNDQKVMETGKIHLFIEKGKMKDGKEATVISLKAPLRNKAGEIIGILGNSIDITEIVDQL